MDSGRSERPAQLRAPVSSANPRGRVGFCMWMVGPLIYVWGGYEVERDRCGEDQLQDGHFGSGQAVYRETNWVRGQQILCYCSDSGFWRRLELNTDGMDSRAHYCRHFLGGFSGSAHCARPDNSELYVCGGFRSEIEPTLFATNSVYAIHVDNNRVSRDGTLRVTCPFSVESWRGGRCPMPRDKHSVVFHAGKLLLFGGYCRYPPPYFIEPVRYCGVELSLDNIFFKEENFCTNDNQQFAWSNELLELDLATGQWQQAACDGPAPSPRAAHSMLRAGDKAYLFGGRVFNRRTNDFYCLDLRQRQWTQLQPAGQLPEPRSWTTFVQAGPGKFFCFGGYPWSDQPCTMDPLSSCFMYDVASNRFVRLQLPERRGLLWHGSCSQPISGRVFVWGGCTEDIMKHQYNSDFNASMLTFSNLRVPPLTALCADAVVPRPDLFPDSELLLRLPVTDGALRRRKLLYGPIVGC